MSSPCLDRAVARHAAALLLLALAALAAGGPARATAEPLRVCLDPDQMPYSRADGAGYEPQLARLLADEIGRPLELHWQPLRRGMVRKTLGAGLCDVLLTVPAGFERVLTTRPYYRSGYVLLTRADDAQPLRSFDDPRLRTLRIGVQLVGDDGATTPPGHVLAARGAQRVIGYTPDGGSADDAGDGPSAARIVHAIERGQLDAAWVWGPQAGWFASRAGVPLHVAAAAAPADAPQPFAFSIAVGVRRGDVELRDRLQAALDARREQVRSLLRSHAVPLLPLERADGPRR